MLAGTFDSHLSCQHRGPGLRRLEDSGTIKSVHPVFMLKAYARGFSGKWRFLESASSRTKKLHNTSFYTIDNVNLLSFLLSQLLKASLSDSLIQSYHARTA